MSFDTYYGWPEARVAEIRSKLAQLGALDAFPFGFHVHPAAAALNYFPPGVDDELEQWTPAPFRYHRTGSLTARPQIAIFHSIGVADEARRIWELREALGPLAIIVLWMWDNHTAYIPNLRSAQAADLVFFSHSTHAEYLQNPASAVAGHLPACSAQWRRDQAAALYQAAGDLPRRHSLFLNYVEYGFATERNAVITAVRENVPEAIVLGMPAGNRSRYFAKSPQQRFAEWMEHKATLVLPISEDLSTRVFDALLCGLVPIVPTNIPDFDLVVSEEDQQRLGIVRIRSYEMDEIRQATQSALRHFDSQGAQGALARHLFVLDHHLLINRITELLHTVYLLINGSISFRFSDGPSGPALYPAPRTS